MTAPTAFRGKVYVLLELSQDGTSRAYIHRGMHDPEEILDVARGNDRGQYRTYEVGGFSVDIVALPQIAREHSDP